MNKLANQAESMATAFRRFASIADMLEYLTEQPGITGPEVAVLTIAVRSIRDALKGEVPYCLSVQYCRERGL